MTSSDFNQLSFEQKGLIWTKNSVFLDERIIYNKSKIVIYSLFNFYVEVTYNVKDNQIEDLRALEGVEDWEGYISSISLDALL